VKAQPATVKQHYVPRFLLARFAADDGKLTVFDKHTDRTWRAAPENCYYENRFNEPTGITMGPRSAENLHGALESYAAPVIAKVLAGTPPEHLTSTDRISLSLFVTVLYLRSPSHRAMHISRSRQMRSLFPGGRLPPTIVEQLGTLTDAEARDMSITMAFSLAKYLEPHLRNKFFFLSTAYPGTSFLVGDSPVVLFNMIKSEHYGNLGFACPGIEIHLPLSSSVMLSCVDPTLIALIEQKSAPMKRCVRTGGRARLAPENMIRYNSLQVRWAERFVASADGDFSLVTRMIKDNETYRRSVRLQAMRGNAPLPEVADWNPTVMKPEELVKRPDPSPRADK
jgi:hypothetical protein